MSNSKSTKGVTTESTGVTTEATGVTTEATGVTGRGFNSSLLWDEAENLPSVFSSSKTSVSFRLFVAVASRSGRDHVITFFFFADAK